MSNVLRNIIRFALFIGLQVFVLFQVKPLHQFIVPYVYFLYILWLPFRMPQVTLTFLGFLLGMTLDLFTRTPGLHAAPCTLLAFVRPWLINMLIFQEGDDKNYREPSITSMAAFPYATYVFILTLLHHVFLVFLEWIQFDSFWFFIGKVLGTTAVSLLLIVIAELLFFRKHQFRTNTA